MSFDKAVAIVLDLEGGDRLVVDSGGVTKWGISARAYPDLDIRSLTRQEAEEIYRRDYWDAAGCDNFAWPLSLVLFDAAVNQGTSAAVRMLQEAAGGLAVDGVLGGKTLSRALSLPAKHISVRLMTQRAMRYTGTRHFDKYGKGWFNRLFKLALAF